MKRVRKLMAHNRGMLRQSIFGATSHKIATIGLAICIFTSMSAAQMPAPDLRSSRISSGAQRALLKSRAESLKQLSHPAIVAGVRGARVDAEALYWKGGAVSADKMIKEAEAMESSEQYEDAMKLYSRIMIEGASGRVLDRASIGWAVCKFRLGDASAAIRRLRALSSRSSDRDIQFSASIPLALALHSTGDAKDALDMLKKLIARHPDHALAGQAEGMILFLSSE